MVSNGWQYRKGSAVNLHFQIFLILSTICYSTRVVAGSQRLSDDTSAPEVSNISGAVDYRTWQQQNIDSTLYIGHGIFLHRANTSNSTDQDWVIRTDDIPKLFNFGFPAANTDNSQSDDPTVSSNADTVRPWVLGLACFVGGLLIMVAITVAILARKWMHNSLNRRRRPRRHREHDQVVVEADPEAAKATGPSTICQGLSRPLPRLGVLPDDGLPPYTRLESPTGFSDIDQSHEDRSQHPLDLPLPSYSEIAPVHRRDTARTRRCQAKESNSDTRKDNFTQSETYPHLPDQRERTPSSKEVIWRFHRQSSSSYSNENRFIPHWCEGEELLSTLEGRDVLGQHPGCHRQQLPQQEITHTDNLSITESSLTSNQSSRQLDCFPSSGSPSLYLSPPPHPPLFIPEGDGFSRVEVSNSTSKASRLAGGVTPPPKHSLPTQADDKASSWSAECSTRRKTYSYDIPSEAGLPLANQRSSAKELPGNDVRRKSLPGAPSAERCSVNSRGCMTQGKMIDCDFLSDIKDGVFIAEEH